MPNDTLNYLSDKSEHDLLVILEGFKMLLADAELFDTVSYTHLTLPTTPYV